jgi:carboxyl-terminal processing protease
MGVWGADGTDYRGRAVDPDVAVDWTRADICAGRDPISRRRFRF